MAMDPKSSTIPRELSDKAKRALAQAEKEMDSGHCKTFSNIDDFFEDLDSD